MFLYLARLRFVHDTDPWLDASGLGNESREAYNCGKFYSMEENLVKLQAIHGGI